MNDVEFFKVADEIRLELKLANNLKLLELFLKYELPEQIISDLILSEGRIVKIKELLSHAKKTAH
jgi:hypothetical protein